MKRTQRVRQILKRRRQRRAHPTKRATRLLGTFGSIAAMLLGLALVISTIILVSGYQDLTHDLPPIQTLDQLMNSETGQLLSPTQFYDRTGTEIILTLENPGIDRRVLPLPSQAKEGQAVLSPFLIEACLDTFDPNFWQHGGFDRSQILDPTPHTLAERLVLRFLLPEEAPSTQRAIKMRLLAAQATDVYGRQQVLSWFLNFTNFGHLAYGVESASQLYFEKSASQLNQAESLLLMAVIQAPALNPLDAPDAAIENWEALIQNLVNASTITPEEANQIQQTPLGFASQPPKESPLAQTFNYLVIEQLSAVIGSEPLMRGGLKVITSLDADLQRQLICGAQAFASLEIDENCPVSTLLPDRVSLFGAPLSADAHLSIVIQDPQTGQILAMLGDYQPSANQEGTFMSEHATGSLITPFIYLAGFQRGMGPASLVWDIPGVIPDALIDFQENPEHYQGPMRLRQAMIGDVMAPAAQLLYQIGLQETKLTLQNFGLDINQWNQIPYDGGSLSPLAISDAFAILANEGVDVGAVSSEENNVLAPIAWLSAATVNGTVLKDNRTPALRPVVSESLAYLVNDVLSDESTRWAFYGYPNPTEIGRPAGVKIGQTFSQTGQWVVGYTPQRVVTLWLNDPAKPPDPMQIASLWQAIMRYSLQDLPLVGWQKPSTIRTVTVCSPSGQLPTEDCPQTISEIFLQGNEPISADTLYKSYQINVETGRLATVFTPKALIIEEVYLEIPENAQDWAQAVSLPQPPEAYDNLQPPSTSETATITSPVPFSLVSGSVPISGTAAGDRFDYYRLEAGQGLNPQSWLQISEIVQIPTEDSLLTTWDTTNLVDGLYALRLQVVSDNQQLETALLQVTVDNTPPSLLLLYPMDGDELPYQNGDPLLCILEVTDPAGIAEIIWFIDGEEVLKITEAPYHLIWERNPGEHTLQVQAVDQAGNQAESPPITFSIVE